jgi:hypothetical protein
MDIKNVVNYVASSFVYKPDPKVLGDSWHVMPLVNNKFTGDCDDFSITCFWYLSNKNLLVFLINLLITHKYALYRCKTINNEWHIVGRFKDLWFDNWSLEALPKEEFFSKTKHIIKMRYYFPIIAWFLIVGLFKK